METEVPLQPPALVARAEGAADWMKLPGIEEFAAGVKQTVRDADEKTAVGRVMSWEIIRQCYEYGSRPAVRKRVDAMNRQPDGSFRRGRPFAGHRLAMEAVATRCGVSLRAVCKWQHSFNEAVRSGALMPNDLNELSSFKSSALAERLEQIEARIEAQAAQASATGPQEEALKPEALGRRLAQILIRRAKLKEGVNPALVRGVVEGLGLVLIRHGYTVFFSDRLAGPIVAVRRRRDVDSGEQGDGLPSSFLAQPDFWCR